MSAVAERPLPAPELRAAEDETASRWERPYVGPKQDVRQGVQIEAQRRWAATPLQERVQLLRKARHAMASHAEAFAAAISPALHRSQADTLVTEVLPLLEAIRFLERKAPAILRTRKLGGTGRPVWLTGVQAEVQRVPLGHVLVIGPANFPLFLPGVQAVQALAAGNAVTWKPGAGGEAVAQLVAERLEESGLPHGVLSITGDSVGDAEHALAQRPDKVVFTGSFASGQKVLHTLADSATPAVMELSGADAVVVLPSANLSATAKAIAFGLRLNGGEVCMSPRRLVATRETLHVLKPLLEAELALLAPVSMSERTANHLRTLLDEATKDGARVIGTWDPAAQRPLLVEEARPEMTIARSDVFAPVLSLLEASSMSHLSEVVNDCPYALTAAVFGQEREARGLGAQLHVGTVLINDLITATADPRVPFAGRGKSGFGATRGAEGLLEMTTPKTVLARRKVFTRPYAPVGAKEVPLFAGLIGVLHGGALRTRVKSMRMLATAGRGR